jgi:plasmid maintenance system antidote protein VapI
MKTARKTKTKETDANRIRETGKVSKLREHILTESAKQSRERKLRNELLAIRYQMEDYIERDSHEHRMSVLDFVKLYLKALSISQRELADIFEMQDSNLYKYFTGERKLNSDLVMKLSHFLHTPPELWYYLQVKNELLDLAGEKEKIRKYRKYDYQKVVLQKAAS